MTAEYLPGTPRDVYRHELVRGVLTGTLPTHVESRGEASARFAVALGNYSDGISFALVTGRGGFQLETNPDTVRAPDVAWFAPGHPAESAEGYPDRAPDLSVEVKSPSDTAAMAAERAQMWLDFGSREVWYGDPEVTTVTRYRQDQSPEILTEGEERNGDDLLPGFSVPVWRLCRRRR